MEITDDRPIRPLQADCNPPDYLRALGGDAMTARPSTRLIKAAEMVGEEAVTLTEMEPSDAWIGKDEYDLREAIQRMRKHTTEQGIIEIFFDELSHERQGNGRRCS